ncbi:MAG: hypothetical protein LBK58_11615 [Prevotellaceae bacterium]|jgi:hypothetical protein|nr:hypothetical protein [Prevotellaceae bacterium]
MELIIINRTYLENKKEPVRQRSIYVSRNGVSFSKGTCDLLQLSPGDKVNFAMEAKKIKKLYIFKAQKDDDAAFEVKQGTRCVMIRARELSAKLLSPFRMNRLLFLVSANPEIAGGYECYQMLPAGIPDTGMNKSKHIRKNEKYEL